MARQNALYLGKILGWGDFAMPNLLNDLNISKLGGGLGRLLAEQNVEQTWENITLLVAHRNTGVEQPIASLLHRPYGQHQSRNAASDKDLNRRWM